MNLHHVKVPKRKSARDSAVELCQRTGDLFPLFIKGVKLTSFLEQLSRANRPVYDRYFRGFRPQKVGRDRLLRAAKAEVLEHNDEMTAHLLIVSWNDSRRRLYEDCRGWLQANVDQKVEDIVTIEADKSRALLTMLLDRHSEDEVSVLVAVNDVRVDHAVRAELLPKLPPVEDDAEEEEAPQAGDAAEAASDEAAKDGDA